MKILRAEKFQPRKRSESKRAKSATSLRKTDWGVLVQHDRFTGKLNLRCAAALKDPGSVKRLLEAGMIDPNGKLTSEAKKKCAELTKKLMPPESVIAAVPELPKTENSGEPEDKQTVKLTASDWAVLVKYDRKSGNLLKYDPKTNELDNTSRAILKDPSIIQRLIDNNMILPGGWLTPGAKKECVRIEQKLKARAADDYSGLEDHPEQLSKGERQSNGELQSNGERESRDLPKKAPEKTAEPEVSYERQSNGEQLSKGELQSKDKHRSKDERQSNGEFQSKAEPATEKPAEQDMQTFFENISYEDPDPERQSNGEPLSKGENLPLDNPNPKDHLDPNPERLSKGERQSKGEKTQKPSKTAVIPTKGSASGETMRPVDLKAVSKPEDRHEERPKRKKKGPGGSGGDITEPPRFSLRDVFHIIFKRKLQIFICFFFVVFIAIIATLLMKPVYEASAQILVKLGRESIFVPTSGNVTPILNINREQQVNSEIEILKSRSLAEKVVAALGPTVIYKSLAEEKSGISNFIFPDSRREMTPDERKAADFESAVAGFMKALNVTGVKKSNVIQVSFKNEDPRMAAMVVNNLSSLYLGLHLAVHKTPQNVKFFQEQTDLLKNKLDQAEEKLKALRKQHNITSIEEQRSLLLGRSSELNTGLNQTISLEAETGKRIRLLRRQLASVPETIAQGEESNQNPYLINTLEARLVELQLEEKKLLTKYTDQSRLVLNVKDEIRMVQQKLEEQETKSYGRKTTGINPTHQRLKEELLSNEAELEALKAKKITQRGHLGELQENLESLNRVELELNQLEQKIEVDRENYRLYLSKVEESRISEAMDSEKIASVSLIGPARSPRKPISPKVVLNILIGIFLGTFASLSLALFREFLDDRIEKIEDVETELQLPVLASIPIFEEKAASA
jgi:uncharacterized protein involved in exopolysaccharide biosynthesis